jgi:hypothetical protein
MFAIGSDLAEGIDVIAFIAIECLIFSATLTPIFFTLCCGVDDDRIHVVIVFVSAAARAFEVVIFEAFVADALAASLNPMGFVVWLPRFTIFAEEEVIVPAFVAPPFAIDLGHVFFIVAFSAMGARCSFVLLVIFGVRVLGRCDGCCGTLGNAVMECEASGISVVGCEKLSGVVVFNAVAGSVILHAVFCV